MMNRTRTETRIQQMLKRRVIPALCAAALMGSTLTAAGCSGNANDNAQNSSNATTSTNDTLVINMDKMDFDVSNRDQDPSYEKNEATKIELAGDSIKVDGKGASSEGSVAKITGEGTYLVSGTLSDGRIIVEASDKDKVHIVLSGADITSSDGPAILITNADKVFLSADENTTNTISDATAYSQENADAGYDAAIYAKCDLTLNGAGTLTVNGNNKHAVFSKDDLVGTSTGKVVLNAPNNEGDGLHAKDSVRVASGTYTISAMGDGLQASKDDDGTKGYISILGGELDISATDKGLHAATVAKVNGGTVNIKQSFEGIEGEQVYVESGEVNLVASDDGINASARDTIKEAFGIATDPEKQAAEESRSRGGQMTMPQQGGQGQQGQQVPPEMPQEDQQNAQQSQQPPSMPQGEQSGQQGQTPPEMPNGQQPGEDGQQNMAPPQMPNRQQQGGADQQPQQTPPEMPQGNDGGERPQMPDGQQAPQGGGAGVQMTMPGAYEGCLIQIDGGTITIEATGDGVDSNGKFTMNGGTMTINQHAPNGMSGTGDSAIDYEYSGTVNGGTLIATGTVGVGVENIESDSQKVLMVSGISASAGDTLSVKDANGNIVKELTAPSSCTQVIVSAPDMLGDGEYSLYVNGTQTTGSTDAGRGAAGRQKMTGGGAGGQESGAAQNVNNGTNA